MKIARIIMDLGITQSQLKNFSDMWTGHKTTILNTVQKNSKNYLSRVRNLIIESEKKGANIILLPAGAFVRTNEITLKHYFENQKNNTVIIGGTFTKIKKTNDVPIKLIINNKHFRIIEVPLFLDKKVYALMGSPNILKDVIGKKLNRQFYIFSGPKTTFFSYPQEIIDEALSIVTKYGHFLNYSVDLLPLDKALKKLEKLNVVREKVLHSIKRNSQVSPDLQNLKNSPESITDNFSETIIVSTKNKLMEEFDSSIVKWLQISNISAMVAISSTILNIKKDFSKVEISNNYPPKNNSKVIAFDSGHHQYSGRYLKSLISVSKTLEQEYNTGQVFLSFWKYFKSSSKSVWVVPEMTYERKQIINGNLVDYIDLFEI